MSDPKVAAKSDTDRFRLDGQTAIVTGGGRGLGREVSLTLVRQGANVVLAGRTEAPLVETEQEITRLGGTALAVPCDISDLEAIDRLVRSSLERFGQIGILVNNAAVGAALKPAEDVTPQDWDALMGTDLRGTFFLTTRVAREMIKAGGGVIVNVTSVMGEVACPRAAPYGAAKAAMSQLTRTLAVEWARYGIRVNAVAPGYIATELTSAIQGDARLMDYVTQRTPLRRMARPEEIASAVLYLASPASSFQTGATVVVDGGWSAW